MRRAPRSCWPSVASANTGVVETRGLRRTLLMALAYLTYDGKLIRAQSYVTLFTLPSSTSDPPCTHTGSVRRRTGPGAASWTWCVMDLVCM